MNKEIVSKVPLARIYCKKSRRDGFLSALVKSVGDNIHIDFLIEYDDRTKRAPEEKF